MKDENKITLAQWNQLSQDGKEKLKKWTLDYGYALDVIPNDSGSFDPACDYAALLTDKQLINIINRNGRDKYKTDGKTLEDLWSMVRELVNSL